MEEIKQQVINLASKPSGHELGMVQGDEGQGRQGAWGPPAPPTAPSLDPAVQLLWPSPSAPAPMRLCPSVLRKRGASLLLFNN